MKEKKIKWKTKHATDFKRIRNFLEELLLDNGVDYDDIEDFINPNKRAVFDPFLMDNMEKAVEMVHDVVKKEGKIFLYVDPDADGMDSSGIFMNFIHNINSNCDIKFKVATGKQHGLRYSDLSEYQKDDFDLIVVPDASVEVKDCVNITRNFTAPILILDHHLIPEEKPNYTDYCTVVNCTENNYPNPQLCGAGVVQKFVEGYIQKYGDEDHLDKTLNTKYYDMVSLALIADNMDLRSKESRFYAIEGIKERYHNNDFINELVIKKEDDMPFGRYIGSMAWKIAPLINGVIRSGADEDKDKMFRAIYGAKEEVIYQPRRKHKEDPKPPVEIQSLQKSMAREAYNIKNNQDKKVREYFKKVLERTQETEAYKNAVIFVDGTDIVDSNTMTGLLCGKITSEYFKPAVLLKEFGSTEYGGSMRGSSYSAITDTKSVLEAAGVTVMGHENAGGIRIKKAELPEVIKKLNEMYPPESAEVIYPCDWEIPAEDLKLDYVREVAEHYDMFCKHVPEPMFAISNIRINASQINIVGEKAGFLRFNYNGISFVKKFCKHDDFDNITLNDGEFFGVNKKELNIDIIGKFVLDKYNDKVEPQIEIIDFGSTEVVGEKPTSSARTGKTERPKKIESVDDFEW